MRSFALLCTLFLCARADTLTLHNGAAVNGSWVGIDGGQISFLVENRVRTYPRSDVSAVVFRTEAAAPSTPSNPEPAIPGAVYFRDDSGTLIPLERNTGNPVGTRLKPYWEMAGARSPVRLRASRKMVFFLRTADSIDPGTYSLVVLETRQVNRRTRFDVNNNKSLLALNFSVAKLGESLYSLTPVNDLAAGEYAFSPGNSNDAYCFGVDR